MERQLVVQKALSVVLLEQESLEKWSDLAAEPEVIANAYENAQELLLCKHVSKPDA